MAIGSESGYGAFLPTYENEYINREALRGQMVKQASYLTEMDTIYAQLEENARQFDVGLEASTEKWQAELAETTRQFDESLALNWAQQETASYSAHAQTSLAQAQLAQNQSQYESTLAFEQQQYANSQSNAANLMNLLTANTNLNTNSNSNSYTTSYVGDTNTMSASGTVYNQYGSVVQGAGQYDYGSYDDYTDYSDLGNFSSYAGGSGTYEGASYSLD